MLIGLAHWPDEMEAVRMNKPSKHLLSLFHCIMALSLYPSASVPILGKLCRIGYGDIVGTLVNNPSKDEKPQSFVMNSLYNVRSQMRSYIRKQALRRSGHANALLPFLSESEIAVGNTIWHDCAFHLPLNANSWQSSKRRI